MLKPALLLGCVAALGFVIQGGVWADDPAMPAGGTAAAPASVPAKGQTMSQVRQHFGEPQRRYAPAGGDAPKHPPITRWDYAGFSVYFEHQHVVDAVVPDRPPRVYHVEQLQALSKP